MIGRDLQYKIFPLVLKWQPNVFLNRAKSYWVMPVDSGFRKYSLLLVSELF